MNNNGQSQLSSMKLRDKNKFGVFYGPVPKWEMTKYFLPRDNSSSNNVFGAAVRDYNNINLMQFTASDQTFVELILNMNKSEFIDNTIKMCINNNANGHTSTQESSVNLNGGDDCDSGVAGLKLGDKAGTGSNTPNNNADEDGDDDGHKSFKTGNVTLSTRSKILLDTSSSINYIENIVVPRANGMSTFYSSVIVTYIHYTYYNSNQDHDNNESEKKNNEVKGVLCS